MFSVNSRLFIAFIDISLLKIENALSIVFLLAG